VDAVAAVVIAYLLGSIDFGAIVPRMMGVDIYERGSGNPGASNVFRTLGKKAGAAVMAGDALKGVVAAGIADVWVGGVVGFAAGFAAVAGHVFPVWLRFRGGRGVATALGAVLWLEPLFGVALVAVWVGVVLVWKVASIASLLVMAAYVPGYVVAGHRGWALGWAGATAVLVVLRHAPNIRRMVAGSEARVTSR
jgi:glycerol-3-phosphate acyltransferase PlsY